MYPLVSLAMGFTPTLKPIGPATRCDEMGQFAASRPSQTIAEYRKSHLCGQSASQDGMFSLSPAMAIAAIVIRNTDNLDSYII